jgi:hypothetical protein
MPNYDAGHYFLTVLAPVRPDPVVIGGVTQSRRHALRDALNVMPTGERTVATQGNTPENPFARSTITHFARFFVLDDVVYNGRVPRDGVLAAILKTNPLQPQKIDRLSSPFLVFAADFDAVGGTQEDLNACLTILWRTMQVELTNIFQHCIGFDSVTDATRFCGYIQRCQIETTMPFNDYWSAPPGLSTFDLKPYIYGGIAAAVIAVIGLFVWRPWLFLLGVLGLGAVVVLVYRAVTGQARLPFPISPPPAPKADLPTVLKSLALQRAFTQFAIETQGKGGQALYDAFGEFIAAGRPDDVTSATQIPGVIGV